MKYTLSDQLLCFGTSVLCGLFLGVFYEIIRLFRIFIKGKRIFVFICDVLFMVVSAFVTVLFSICYSKGITRYFTLFGEFIGVLFVRITLGRLSVRFFVPLLRKLMIKSRKIAVNMGKLAKKLLQVIANILYNNSRKNGVAVHSRDLSKSKRRGKRYHGVKTAE